MSTVSGGRSIEVLPERAYRLLVAIEHGTSAADAERLVDLAAAITRERDGALVVACLDVVSRQTPLDGVPPDDPILAETRAMATRLIETTVPEGVPAASIVCLTHAENDSILNLVEERGCDGVAVGVDPNRSHRRRLIAGDAAEWVVSRADGDVFVAKREAEATPIDRVLLAAGGGPHADAAAGVARALARATGAHVDVVHFLGENATGGEREDADGVVGIAERTIEGVASVGTEVVTADNPAAAIIDRSDEYDVTVLGAPTSGLLRQFVFGTVPDRVNRDSPNAVVMARGEVGPRSRYDRWIRGDPST